MCTDCGCGDPELVPVEVHEKLLAGNDKIAAENRARLARHGVLAINLMGSPGCGKTALLEAVSKASGGKLRLSGVSGDLETDNDARRLEKAGITARAITTGTACHLDARLVSRALDDFDLSACDIFFIENVGNLVCPAIYALGQAFNVVGLSVTEGVDKPLKYPVMFKAADLVLLTKTDLLPYLPEISVEAIRDSLARVTSAPVLLPVSAKSGEGLPEFISWLQSRRAQLPARPQRSGAEARP